ncbi:o-methyltransferase [Hirsutella rhossiliensis]|uniref:O-methyltransferase domain-containing protein n=1 Tax=Hirsutella rhossiliensis TaxID=111463 RepID=A0A9P8SDS2_9HYPO|nr:o-methyltransferase domain-containing protein [Hirsutella rhossiliensis]KAH0958906.1 o-methyltransferase domain-containing protein [Hirsutella rhossiliensis]
MKDNCTTLYPNDVVARKVSEYADRNSVDLPDALLQYHQWVLDTQPRCAMTISLLEARLLTWLARTVGVKRVLEVGVFVGFSLGVWANAVGPEGAVTGLEQSAEYAALAREQLLKHGYDNCRILEGDALQVLPTLQPDEPFDMVFIDAQKSGYPDYLAAILDRSQPGARRRLLRPGGLIVGDNALRSALVVDQSDDNPAARTVPGETPNWDWDAMRRLDEFNTMMHSHERIEAMLLPVFDGLGMGRLLD